MLLHIYAIDLKTYAHTKTCTQIFIATLFIITKNWKQPRCPLHTHMMEYYWAIKNDLLSHKKTWRNLK